MVRQYASLLALTAICNVALAETYQGEGRGSYNNVDSDKVYELSATAYFAPVSTGSHPLREAAFLERASNASLTYSRFGSAPDQLNLTGVNVGYYVPNSIFYLGGHYTRIDESQDEFAPDYNDSEWGLTLGVTPTEGLLISTSYRVAPFNAGSIVARHIGSGITAGRDSYETNLSAKYVTDLSGGRAANFEGGMVRTDFYDLLFLGADYYLDPTLSIGAWIEDFGSIAADPGIGIRAEKFITEGFSLQGSYFDFNGTHLWQIAVGVRL